MMGVVLKVHRRRQWHPTPVLLPGKPHGRRSLVGCSPWGREESDTTERLHFHFLLSCIGEGHGNPLQCSCLENPRDGGAWWAAVYGVVKSQIQLRDFTFTFHFSLACIREGHGNPLQCSCLDNPRDGGAWWAAVYGVAQSRTRLKRFSSSNSSIMGLCCPHTYIYHTAAEFYQVYLVGATWCQNDDPEEINTLNNQSCKPKPTEWLELRLISLLFFIILHLILKV